MPEAVWLPPFDAYRAAVGDSTEAADEHHFASLRAVLGGFFGRRVSVHYGRRTFVPDNVILIGPTNDKKTTAQRRAAEFLTRLSPEVGVIAALNSAEGLLEWLAARDMTADELATFLQCLNNNKSAPWVRRHPEHRRGLAIIEEMAVVLQKSKMDGSASLIATLTQLHDMPDIVAPALRARRFAAEAPTFTILGASTAEWMTENLSRVDIMGGFGNRQQFFTGPAKAPKDWPDPPDDRQLDKLARKVEQQFSHWPPGTAFKLTAPARRAWKAFYDTWTRELQMEGDVSTSRLESRIPEHAIKQALLYAALGNDSPEINQDQIEAASQVAHYLRDSVRFAFRDNIDTGETPAAKLERRMLELLAKGPMSKRALQQNSKQRNTTAIEFNRALESLAKLATVRLDAAGIVSLA